MIVVVQHCTVICRGQKGGTEAIEINGCQSRDLGGGKGDRGGVWEGGSGKGMYGRYKAGPHKAVHHHP